MKIVITKFPDIPNEELQQDLGRTLLMLFAQSGLVQDGMRISFVEDDPCRFAAKRTYANEAEANAGTAEIRATAEANGRVYQQLYPYKCPDAEHWHLSHYEQAVGHCPVCEAWHPAWRGSTDDERWIMSGHENADGAKCSGEGQLAAALSPIGEG